VKDKENEKNEDNKGDKKENDDVRDDKKKDVDEI
jgi:hypothetical protein